MLWRVQNHTFDLGKRSLLMGVLNVTPDSFSDGGRYLNPKDAVERGLAMAEAGADILDIGGESSRPGAAPVSLEEELRRVLPVVQELSKICGAKISIDTYKAEVAREAVESGASIINDIGGLQTEKMREVVRDTGAGAIAMHMQGTPATMQKAPFYEDVVLEVSTFFERTLRVCAESGIPAEQIALDPGIGFGKSAEHNLLILKNLARFQNLGRPLAIGASRKSFLSAVTRQAAVEDRMWPTVALTSYARERGAAVLRVHDVRPNVEALRMTEAILEACA
ncbi:MAG: dihydropteroate synthase [Verrucomicrobia bacterium]|nr:dihydropteroate synthase [Verrucomicrobiota bacterium]